MTPAAMKDEATRISGMLGLYKAEWLNGKLFDLFTEPEYIGELRTKRPCVLIGGRGTGKTTVLRGLSYEGQFARGNRDPSKITTWEFFGLYHRINTNRVTAFRGPELSEEKWIAHFAHYVNLTFCLQVLEFIGWYELQTGETLTLSPRAMRRVRATLNLPGDGDLSTLEEEVEYLLVQFEAAINSISDEAGLALTMQGAPIDTLTEELSKAPAFAGKQFFFLIDEFENLEDYQQRVFNTLIKHATPAYTFKIGVRELGWRQRATLNPNEQLTSPADYARIGISEVLAGAKFKAFAERVIASRLAGDSGASTAAADIASILPGLSELEEARLLLDERDIVELHTSLESALEPQLAQRAKELQPGVLFFLHYWTQRESAESFGEAIQGWLAEDSKWTTRFQNHFFAAMFSIRKGKRGIRKYYCGWETYLALSNSNIRYLLELVHTAFLAHTADGGDPAGPIPPDVQTKAAQAVGRKNLAELEGLSVDGAQLTKLLLSLGRIFQLLADDPAGHAPEVNQFHLRSNAPVTPELDQFTRRLLGHAVMHLALVRFAGSKPMDDADTKEYDYTVHPIYAPFFVFSHRRKRKLALEPEQLRRLIEVPRETIREVLVKNNRDADGDLPDQLRLFDSYYA